MSALNVNLAPALRRMRAGAPARLRVWARWLEPIDRIIGNGHGIDCSFHTEDWEEWRREPEHQEKWNAMIESDEYNAAVGYAQRVEVKIRHYGREFFFDQMLWNKRQDEHFHRVLDSIEHRGFIRPLTVLSAPGTSTGYKFGDGGHRLAAAQDLGYTHVPVQMVPGMGVCGDAGDWGWSDGEEYVEPSLRKMLI